jgi:PA14 domain
MRRILFLFALSAIAASSQTPSPSTGANNPPPPPPEIPYTLQITTREVLVDVIAVDSRNQPIVDLTAADLKAVEEISPSHELPVSISSLRLIDPTAVDPGPLPGGGFRIAANESCLQRQTIHYELAYHPGPQGLTSGYHEVLILSSRRGVRLFYRHSYYIGATAPSDSTPQKSSSEIDHELQIDACSHPVAPLSISLRAYRISTGSEDHVRYGVSIESGSLDFVSYPENRRQLQLDYGACNFSAAGRPINYMNASTDQVLTPVEFARAQAHGFNRLFDFAPPKDLAMTRFVVRDRATGNLGLVDVTFPLPEESPHADPAVMEELRREILWNEQAQAKQEEAEAIAGAAGVKPPPPSHLYTVPPKGPLGSFGSVVPHSNAFCGDVYELQANILRLPDFRALDPIGSIYSYSLAVPNQIFEGTNGIAGVTDRTIWFGVDYHASFWIRKAGTYNFEMTSDDGAILQIDDQRVIDLDNLHSALTKPGHIALDAGRHTIHVPYYEGTPYAVALSLWVRNPGEEDWKIFDLRDFADPEEHSIRTQP